MKRFLFYFAFTSLLFACSHYKDVRPGANGIHHVVVRAQDAYGAERKAVKEANYYCEKEHNGSKALFVKEEKTQYTGSLDEETRNTIRQAGQAAMVAGAALSAGYPNPVGAAGAGAYVFASGNDYTAEMHFRCGSPDQKERE